MNKDFDGSLFPCPLCESNCYPIDDSNIITSLKCSKCNEEWAALYIRGFWAGYVKREMRNKK